MGTSGSKECGGDGEAGQSSASESNGRKSRVRSVCGSSCIKLACRTGETAESIQIPRHRNKDKNHNTQFVDHKGSQSHHENTQCYRKVEAKHPFGFDVEDLAASTRPDIVNATNQPANHSTSLLSQFNLFPSSLSFGIGRHASAGSSRENTYATEFLISGADGAIYEADTLPPVLTNGNVNIQETDTYKNRQDIEFTCDVACSERPGCLNNVPNLTNYVDTDNIHQQPAERRDGNQEPIEHNVRFSRSLSVGRLRDRVLRRSSTYDPTVLPLQQDEEVMNIRSNTMATNAERLSPSRGNNSTTPAATEGGQDHVAESSLPRETRHHDVLEHRSNFLERRRRIRSQVRALQRLGNRFENLSGHERACIMSGQHRTGRCTCRAGTRVGNSTDDSTARGSISRIVMLAEALFEVLDEMHQQSVVLSSQPSISSIGSVPAPSKVVESLPVKLHSKLQINHSDEVAQCYVCLLEYEEGDKIRVLPCNHEFHKTCIDKWLKEIHRVCPLCRGDICRSGTSHPESQM